MPVWRFEDDCLAPRRRLKVEYTGPNPFKVYLTLKPKLRRIFQVETVGIWERDFRWDTTSDPRSFYIRVYVDKGLDQFSRMFVEITMQGEQPSDPNKSGKLTIYIGGRIRTNYELQTIFQRSPVYKAIRWLYHMIFYNKVRRTYIRLCTEMIERLWKELREELGIPIPREVV